MCIRDGPRYGGTAGHGVFRPVKPEGEDDKAIWEDRVDMLRALLKHRAVQRPTLATLAGLGL